jgi:hypothetical protein
LPNKEDDLVLIHLLFIYDSWYVFQLFEYLFIQEADEDLVLKSKRGNFLKDISGCIFEVYSIEFLKQLENYLVFDEFIVDCNLFHRSKRNLSDFQVLHIQEFVDDLHILRDVEKDPMLRVHHHIFTRIDNSLNPQISLVSFIAELVITVGGLQPVVAI